MKYKITADYTFEDYYALQYDALHKAGLTSPDRANMVKFCGVILLICFFLLYINEDKKDIFFYLTYTPFLILGILAFFPTVMNKLFGWIITKNVYKRDKPSLSNIHIQINNEGINVEKKGVKSELTWEAFLYVTILTDIIILYHAPRAAILLPKRYFADQEEWNNIKSLIKEKMSSTE